MKGTTVGNQWTGDPLVDWRRRARDAVAIIYYQNYRIQMVPVSYDVILAG